MDLTSDFCQSESHDFCQPGPRVFVGLGLMIFVSLGLMIFVSLGLFVFVSLGHFVFVSLGLMFYDAFFVRISGSHYHLCILSVLGSMLDPFEKQIGTTNTNLGSVLRYLATSDTNQTRALKRIKTQLRTAAKR